MDDISSKQEGHFEIDIEKGRISGELCSSGGLVFGNTKMNNLHPETVNGGLGCCIGSIDSNGVDSVENVKPKIKAMSAKKPPRPPRGVSLDSADQKLIRELHELAKLKRARIERMKALKKAKEAKVSSSKNHLFATLLTVLFGFVLLFQGISSRTNSVASLKGSLISSGTTQSNTVSLQQQIVPLTSNFDEPNYKSPSFVKRVSGFDAQE